MKMRQKDKESSRPELVEENFDHWEKPTKVEPSQAPIDIPDEPKESLARRSNDNHQHG